MRKILLFVFLFIVSFCLGYFISLKLNVNKSASINVTKKVVEKPLEKYSIENLSEEEYRSESFNIIGKILNEDNFTSSLFEYIFYPGFDNNIKKTTGVINIPLNNNNSTHPIALLIRGYVDQEIYTSGMGTKNFGQYLTNNGYITIAPDFLGYAGSDSEAGNIFESRFQTYVTMLSLINYIEKNGIDGWDGKNIVIWGHSNGGQIALTTLEVSCKSYPTVLWAPVSKPFPYSVLYYTDESEDHGKLIRSELAKFETLYDVEKYSLTNYLDKINAPIQIHQGSADEAVPVGWSDSLVSSLKNLDKNTIYIKHSGADHNMNPDWNNAAKESLSFFNEHLIQ